MAVTRFVDRIKIHDPKHPIVNKVSKFATGTKNGKFELLSSFQSPSEYVYAALEIHAMDSTQLPRRYAKCDGALNNAVFPAWYSLSALYAARCFWGERGTADLGGSLTEGMVGRAGRFAPALADDEAARPEENAKEDLWTGASFDVSRRSCRDGTLLAHPLAANILTTGWISATSKRM
jgi:hypothetical protein